MGGDQTTAVAASLESEVTGAGGVSEVNVAVHVAEHEAAVVSDLVIEANVEPLLARVCTDVVVEPDIFVAGVEAEVRCDVVLQTDGDAGRIVVFTEEAAAVLDAAPEATLGVEFDTVARSEAHLTEEAFDVARAPLSTDAAPATGSAEVLLDALITNVDAEVVALESESRFPGCVVGIDHVRIALTEDGLTVRTAEVETSDLRADFTTEDAQAVDATVEGRVDVAVVDEVGQLDVGVLTSLEAGDETQRGVDRTSAKGDAIQFRTVGIGELGVGTTNEGEACAARVEANDRTIPDVVTVVPALVAVVRGEVAALEQVLTDLGVDATDGRAEALAGELAVEGHREFVDLNTEAVVRRPRRAAERSVVVTAVVAADATEGVTEDDRALVRGVLISLAADVERQFVQDVEVSGHAHRALGVGDGAVADAGRSTVGGETEVAVVAVSTENEEVRITSDVDAATLFAAFQLGESLFDAGHIFLQLVDVNAEARKFLFERAGQSLEVFDVGAPVLHAVDIALHGLEHVADVADVSRLHTLHGFFQGGDAIFVVSQLTLKAHVELVQRHSELVAAERAVASVETVRVTEENAALQVSQSFVGPVVVRNIREVILTESRGDETNAEDSGQSELERAVHICSFLCLDPNTQERDICSATAMHILSLSSLCSAAASRASRVLRVLFHLISQVLQLSPGSVQDCNPRLF